MADLFSSSIPASPTYVAPKIPMPTMPAPRPSISFSTPVTAPQQQLMVRMPATATTAAKTVLKPGVFLASGVPVVGSGDAQVLAQAQAQQDAMVQQCAAAHGVWNPQTGLCELQPGMSGTTKLLIGGAVVIGVGALIYFLTRKKA